jgi:uncharacterized protein (TIGR03084 family)
VRWSPESVGARAAQRGGARHVGVDPVIAALAAQHEDLSALVGPLDAAGWATPSRCAGWSVADVVLHLAQTDEMALGSLHGRLDEVVDELTAGVGPAASVDEGAGLMVDGQRGRPPAEVLARWRAASDALVDQLGVADPGRRVTWVAGELSARTLATTRLAEAWIHTGDIAVPLGAEVAADDRLWHIARLAWRTLPYAFAQAGHEPAGPVAFELTAPDGDWWHFTSDDPAATTITGPAVDLCQVAGQRAEATDTGLRGRGPDAEAVLSLVRTFA